MKLCCCLLITKAAYSFCNTIRGISLKEEYMCAINNICVFSNKNCFSSSYLKFVLALRNVFSACEVYLTTVLVKLI